MTALQADRRNDLKLSRDVSDFDRGGFEMILAWFEKWRIDIGLMLDREAAKRFWREAVNTKPRQDWQLKQWGEAMAWRLNWIEVCRQHGRTPTSIVARADENSGNREWRSAWFAAEYPEKL